LIIFIDAPYQVKEFLGVNGPVETGIYVITDGILQLRMELVFGETKETGTRMFQSHQLDIAVIDRYGIDIDECTDAIALGEFLS
jgi:hypothetical protein